MDWIGRVQRGSKPKPVGHVVVGDHPAVGREVGVGASNHAVRGSKLVLRRLGVGVAVRVKLPKTVACEKLGEKELKKV